MITFTTGMKLLRAKNYETVYKQSIEALRINEKNPLPFFLLGVLASDTGSHGKSLELFAKACEHGAENVYYQTYFAKALAALGYHDLAKKHADIAAGLGTQDALLADMIGVVYSRTGYHNLAIPFFEQAVKKNPRWAKFQFNLGASAEFIGDFEKAKTAYKNVLSLEPKFYLAWFSLVALEKQTPDNNQLEKLKTLFTSAAGDAEAQLLLGHAAAKTLEDLERFEESFTWLEKGKALKRNQVGYNQKTTSELFRTAKTVAATAADSRLASSTASALVPIFVVGLPRTGTTLVDRILSSHPKVRSAGELTLFSELAQAAAQTPINGHINADTFLASARIDMSSVGQAYLDKTKDLALNTNLVLNKNGDTTHLIDKMPLNFFYVGLIHRALPNAKIIVLRRGALDSCLSNYRQLFATHNRNYDYSYDIENTASYYREFDALIAHWRVIIPPDRFTEIAYEDIVNDQENQTRKLLDFCELDWDEACMNFHKNTAPVATASAVQVRQPLYSGAIGRWKKYGNKLNALKAALGDLAG